MKSKKIGIIIIFIWLPLLKYAQSTIVPHTLPKVTSTPNPLNDFQNELFNLTPNRSYSQLDIYNNDKLLLQRRNESLQQDITQDYFTNYVLNYGLPSQFDGEGVGMYHEAFNKIMDMLDGTIPINLKDAVFIVEDTYFEGNLDRDEYENSINELINIAKQKCLEEAKDWSNSITKKIMIFRLMSDTLQIKNPVQEKTITSFPMVYDFDDYRGISDWSKMFVSKLLSTKKGQCHSLPLLYLILCEQINTEAYLAYSPSHSYIKIKDNSDNWYNLELTNGRIVSDAYIVGSGFVTSEAIKQGTYLHPQTKEQVIANCLSDLALGYIHKYGYDTFISQSTDSILKYDPKNLSAKMIKANYETIRFEYIVDQLNRPHPDILMSQYPKAHLLLENLKDLYRQIDESGYSEMPPEAYNEWLMTMEEYRQKQEYEEKNNKVLHFSN